MTMGRLKSKKLPGIKIVLLVAVFFALGSAADSGQARTWRLSANGTLLNGFLRGEPNRSSANWVAGIWLRADKCTQSTPCFSCQGGYCEFFKDNTYECGSVVVRECLPESPKDKGFEAGAPEILGKNPQDKGIYRVIDEKTIELENREPEDAR